MKAMVVVMTESAITFPKDPSKPHAVVLYRKSCIQKISILCKAASMNTLMI